MIATSTFNSRVPHIELYSYNVNIKISQEMSSARWSLVELISICNVSVHTWFNAIPLGGQEFHSFTSLTSHDKRPHESLLIDYLIHNNCETTRKSATEMIFPLFTKIVIIYTLHCCI